MRASQGGVIDPSPDADDVPVEPMVAKVILDLLETTLDDERGDAVHDGDESRQSHARRRSRHGLLPNADVEKTARALSGKIPQSEGPDIADQNGQPGIGEADIENGSGKLTPHFSSSKHSLSSDSVGVRRCQACSPTKRAIP